MSQAPVDLTADQQMRLLALNFVVDHFLPTPPQGTIEKADLVFTYIALGEVPIPLEETAP